MARFVPRHFCILEGCLQERFNLHIDETGNQDFSEGLYLVAVVLHEHAVSIEDPIHAYEERLRLAGLDILVGVSGVPFSRVGYGAILESKAPSFKCKTTGVLG